MAKLGDAPAGTSIGNYKLDDLIQPKNSRDMVLQHVKMMLFGPSCKGKTVCACSASEKFPEGKLSRDNEAVLDDIHVIQFDNNGVDSLGGLGLSVPYVADLSNAPPSLVESAITKIVEGQIKPNIDLGITKTVIVDSVTSMDLALKTYYSGLYEKWGLWSKLLSAHQQIFQSLRSLPCNVVFVCHGKAPPPLGDNEDGAAAVAQKAKQRASGTDAGEVDIDITGQSKEFYRRMMSAIYPVNCLGAKGKKTYSVYPGGMTGYYSKNRYQGLETQEPAHLQRLFQKIKEHN